MVEGVSLRAISRLTDTGKNTLARLLSEFGSVCAAYHNRTVRNVRVRRLQCDEVWTFIGAKAKNTSPEKKAAGWGDTWTWTAIDADSKLCVSYFVGGRDLGWAKEFMEDCASRIRGRVQVTTDGHRAYLEAVESAFGMDVDYAQLQKIYGAPSDEEARRYSPARCIGTDMKVVSGALRKSTYLFDGPCMIRYARRHRWSDSKTLVNAAKIVMHEVDRHSSNMIVDFL